MRMEKGKRNSVSHGLGRESRDRVQIQDVFGRGSIGVSVTLSEEEDIFSRASREKSTREPEKNRNEVIRTR